jgi:hypothetical protein
MNRAACRVGPPIGNRRELDLSSPHSGGLSPGALLVSNESLSFTSEIDQNRRGLRMKSEKVLLPPVLVKPEVRQAIEAAAEQRGGGSLAGVIREALTDRFGQPNHTVAAQ